MARKDSKLVINFNWKPRTVFVFMEIRNEQQTIQQFVDGPRLSGRPS